MAHVFCGRRLFAAISLVFVAGALLARGAGIGFDDSPLVWFWQFLDPELLRHDLLRSVALLHSQPPAFNLFLGGVLKASGGHATLVFSVLFAAMGLALLFAMAALMRHLHVPDPLIWLLCALFALHPTFTIYTRWLFYTVPVALLVTLSALALQRYAERPDAGRAAEFAAVSGTLMLTRAIFHPLWLIGAFAVALPRLERVARRGLLIAALAALVAANLWYAKNWVQVRSYGASSWLGMNLRRGWRVEPDASRIDPARRALDRARRGWDVSRAELHDLIDAGAVPPVWAVPAFAAPRAFRPFGYFAGTEDCAPAVCALRKSTGGVNYNHRDYARVSAAMLRGDLAVIRTYPGRYLRRVGHALWDFLQPGPRIVFGRYDLGEVNRLRDGWNRVLFLSGLFASSPPGTPAGSLNLLFVALPALWLFAVVRSFTAVEAAERATLGYIALTILWFTACANLLEIGETDRMRFEIDPLLVVLLGAAVTRALERARSRRESRAGSRRRLVPDG